jgi:hypothetical protein
MRVRYTDAAGCPLGQFVISADTADERAILTQFLSADRKVWQFWIHGWGSTLRLEGWDGHDSFNFGWIRRPTLRQRVGWKLVRLRRWWNEPVILRRKTQ